MSALLYRLRCELKNQFFDMLHHPAKLVTYLFLIIFLATSLLGNMQTSSHGQAGGHFADIRILHGVYFGLLLFLFVRVLLDGFNKGATFFSMCDVNIMFVSPLSARKILAYGLVRQMGSSLLMVVFLMFYGGMMTDMFGIVWWQTMMLMIGVAVTLFAAQVLAMLVYSLVNGRPAVSFTVKTVIYAYTALAAFLPVFLFFSKKDSSMEAFLSAVSSTALQWIPFAGWVKSAVFGAMFGNMGAVVLFGGLTVVFTAGAMLFFMKSDVDYYEDVLDSTQLGDEKRHTKRKNSMEAFAFTPKNVKVSDTGLGGGRGASAFFYKHLREMRRRSRVLFMDGFTFLLLGCDVAVCVIMNRMATFDEEAIPVSILLLTALCLNCYLLFFGNLGGDWVRETKKYYVFLVPESPFAKLVWSSMTTVLKPAVDGILIFTVLGIAFHADFLMVLACILVYPSMGLLYLSVNVLFMRLIGQMANKGLLMLLYMLILGLIAAPGIAGSVALLIMTEANAAPVLLALPVVVWDLLVSAGIFALCRNIIEIGTE